MLVNNFHWYLKWTSTLPIYFFIVVNNEHFLQRNTLQMKMCYMQEWSIEKIVNTFTCTRQTNQNIIKCKKIKDHTGASWVTNIYKMLLSPKEYIASKFKYPLSVSYTKNVVHQNFSRVQGEQDPSDLDLWCNIWPITICCSGKISHTHCSSKCSDPFVSVKTWKSIC